MLIPRSLFARIAVVYLVLLLVLGGLCLWLTVINGSRFVSEMEQRFNLMTAPHIAGELAQPLRRDPAGSAVQRIAARIVRVNPTLDLYVLDRQGRILAAYGCSEPRRRRVAIEPVQGLLQASATLPVRGDDPCDATGKKVFSAARVDLGAGGYGYLYAVLTSPLHTSAASRARGSYLLRTSALILLFALLFTGVLGLLLFAWITRRFRHLIAAVRSYEAGGHSAPAPAHSADEIGELGRAFNEMAATIDAQVQALEHTDAARRELVANLSHDFRTPLTSLRGYIERLQAGHGEVGAQDRSRYLQAAYDNTGRLEHLADALSDLSRLESYSTPMRPEAFALAELIQDLLVKFRPQAEAARVRLGADDLQQLPAVEADIGLIERALANLVDNAIQACHAGGQVTIGAQRQGEHVRIMVCDNGVGIPASELLQVTWRFYRTAASRKRRAAGSGLGLAIANEIVALHGGRLALHSREGEGTTLTFTLAVAAPVSAAGL